MTTSVNITSIRNAAELGKAVNPFVFASEVEALYKGIKIVGVQNLDVFYMDGNIKSKMKASNLSERILAVADFGVRLLYRFSDYDSGRLEKHFGIKGKLEYILHDLPFFTPAFLKTEVVADIITIQSLLNALCKKN